MKKLCFTIFFISIYVIPSFAQNSEADNIEKYISKQTQVIDLGGAYSMRKENEIGSIEKGKATDMVVLDRNLFEIDQNLIMDTSEGGKPRWPRLYY